LLSRVTNRAPGMCAARYRPFVNVLIWSPRLCRTKVGRSRPARRCRVSADARPCRAACAFSAEVATFCRSSSQRICSSVAPGIISEVNTRRNTESSRP
jgi:hypothetical protein